MKKLALLSMFLALPLSAETLIWDGDSDSVGSIQEMPIRDSIDSAVAKVLIEDIATLKARVERDEKIGVETWKCFSMALAGAGADLFATAAALKFNQNSREANPLGFDTEARVGLKIGMLSAQGVACYETAKSGNKKLQGILKYTVAAIHAALTINNSIVAIRGDNK